MNERTKMSLPQLFEMKRQGRKITMVTAYDYPTGVLVDRAGMDIVLVGDSLGMTILGYSSTLPVTMEDMVKHTRGVTTGCKYAFVLGDMPYMSYQCSTSEAVANAGRLMAEGGCDGVKLEGGVTMAPAVAAITAAGVPVMGHLGLTPQSMSMLGGFKVQGKGAAGAKRLVEDARAIEEAGAFAILLECVPTKVAGLITRRTSVPVISIGAGPECDGQLLIFHDMFGLYPNFTPKFAKQYANVGEVIVSGLSQYCEEVRAGAFPEKQHCFSIPDDEFKRLTAELDGTA
jgi:3-methyl-2-oxobutanoate hydroxymethyltransferase